MPQLKTRLDVGSPAFKASREHHAALAADLREMGNGNDILEGTFKNRYNSAQASSGRIMVVNDLAVVP